MASGGVPMGATSAIVDRRIEDDGAAEKIGTSDDQLVHGLAPPDTHGHNTIYLDNSIPFEAYHWWANRSRQVESLIKPDAGFQKIFRSVLGRKSGTTDEKPSPVTVSHSNGVDGSGKGRSGMPKATHSKIASNAYEGKSDKWGITEADWEQAQRAGRTATWGAVFYLITTDILGPYSVPWAFAQMGYAPGMVRTSECDPASAADFR